jgi:hypothetical protein
VGPSGAFDDDQRAAAFRQVCREAGDGPWGRPFASVEQYDLVARLQCRLAALQRLFNLGFGNDDPKADFSGWTPADRTAAVEAFQRANPPLAVNGNIDDSATQERLRQEHGS